MNACKDWPFFKAVEVFSKVASFFIVKYPISTLWKLDAHSTAKSSILCSTIQQVPLNNLDLRSHFWEIETDKAHREMFSSV